MQFVIRKSQLCHADGGRGHGWSQRGSWGDTMFSVAKLGITKPESLRISLTEMTVEGSGFLCKRCSFPPPHSLSLIKIAGCCTGAEIWWVLHLDKKKEGILPCDQRGNKFCLQQEKTSWQHDLGPRHERTNYKIAAMLPIDQSSFQGISTE